MLEMGSQLTTTVTNRRATWLNTSQPKALFWFSEELVDSWHDLGSLVAYKASEAMLRVAPSLLVVIKHSSCPPYLANPDK